MALQKRAEGELIADGLARDASQCATGLTPESARDGLIAKDLPRNAIIRGARASRVRRRARTRHSGSPRNARASRVRLCKRTRRPPLAGNSPLALRAVGEQGVEILQDAARSSGHLRLRHQQSRLPCALLLVSLSCD